MALRVARRDHLGAATGAGADRCSRLSCRAGRGPGRFTAGCCCGASASGSHCRVGRFAICPVCWWSATTCRGWTSSTIGAVLPAGRWRPVPLSFVARADMAGNLAVRMMARIVKAIPIERSSLRRLPEVVAAVAARLYAGHTVVAFPEGTTWCGMPGDAARRRCGPCRGRGRQGNRAMRARKPANRTAGRGRFIRRCFRPPSTPADRSSRCGCLSPSSTAASRQSRPISATTHCCVRSVGCSSRAAPWRGFTSNHCSSRRRSAGAGPSLPAAMGVATASQRPGHRGRAGGVLSRSGGVGILGGHGLPGSRRYHPDAPCCRRGDDGRAGHRGQCLVAAHQRSGRSAADGGIPRADRGQARCAPVRGDLHRGRHRDATTWPSKASTGPAATPSRGTGASSPGRWSTTPCWIR